MDSSLKIAGRYNSKKAQFEFLSQSGEFCEIETETFYNLFSDTPFGQEMGALAIMQLVKEALTGE